MKSFKYTLPQGFVGEVRSNQEFEFSKKEEFLLGAYVPGIQLTDSSQEPQSQIIHNEQPATSVKVSENLVEINGPWSGKLSPDVYHALGGIARNHYLAQNQFPVHAASVGLDDLVLLVGHSGSGKTSVSLELADTYGWKFASGNKTVVDFDGEMNVVAGTKTMTGRVADLRTYDNEVVYGDRKAFQLGDEQYVESGKVGSIVLVRLSDGREEWSELEGISELHTLYPYFLDTVNADVIVGSQAVLDGTPSLDTRNHLVRRLSESLADVPVYKATGSIDYIAKRIAEGRK